MNEKHSVEPLLSVITLTYNNLRYLPETIDSILTQSYQNLELIISDDASIDFNIGYWKSYIRERYPQFDGRVIIRKNEVNLGTVSHCNVAIKCSSGKYVKLLSSGDLFASPISSAYLVEKMEQNKWQIVNSISAVYDEKMRTLKGYYPTRKNLLKMGSLTSAEQFLILTGYNAVGAIGVIFTRDLYDKSGGFDENYHLTEDWPMWLKLTRSGIRIESINFVSTIYRLGGISGFGTKNPVLHKDFILLMEREILLFSEFFNARQRRDLQTQYDKALRWGEFSLAQKLWFVMRHIGYFIRHKLIR